jgi:hypothetical protein
MKTFLLSTEKNLYFDHQNLMQKLPEIRPDVAVYILVRKPIHCSTKERILKCTHCS